MDEAEISLKPRTCDCGWQDGKKTGKGIVLLCGALIAALIILIGNNYIIYQSYRNILDELKIKSEKLANTEKKLNIESLEQRIIKENDELKKKFDEILVQNKKLILEIQEVKNKNEVLEKSNKQLAEDNIELQNSLKKAASVGVKPQNYTSFDGISMNTKLERGTYIGKFLGTAYTPSKDECGNNKGITYSGNPIVPGVSLAIDKKHWPFGTVFYIKGLGYAVAMDTGSAIKGKYRFDFAVFDKKFADKLGVDYWEVFLVKLGNGNVTDLKF